MKDEPSYYEILEFVVGALETAERFYPNPSASKHIVMQEEVFNRNMNWLVSQARIKGLFEEKIMDLSDQVSQRMSERQKLLDLYELGRVNGDYSAFFDFLDKMRSE